MRLKERELGGGALPLGPAGGLKPVRGGEEPLRCDAAELRLTFVSSCCHSRGVRVGRLRGMSFPARADGGGPGVRVTGFQFARAPGMVCPNPTLCQQ